MLKEVFEVSEDGFIKDIHAAEVVDGELITELEGHIVLEGIPQPNYLIKPRWIDKFKIWVEGASKDEISKIDESALLEAMVPTQEELSDADFEIKVITLLMDMGVI